MKKRILAVSFVLAAVVALGVSASAAGTPVTVDTSAITASFGTAVQSTIDMILAVAPVGLTLFALSFALKKSIRLLRGM